MLYIEVIPMQDESESKKLTKQLYHYVQKNFIWWIVLRFLSAPINEVKPLLEVLVDKWCYFIGGTMLNHTILLQQMVDNDTILFPSLH